MSRALIILALAADRAKAARWIAAAPWNTRVTFQGPKRSPPQNDKMWAMLTEVSTQLGWHGQKYSPDDWKDYFMHAMRRARWMPSEDGGMIPVGLRTSELDKEEMSDLIEMMHEFGARHSVVFHDHTAPAEREREEA